MKFTFTKKYEYDGKMDKEVISLCDVMNALPCIKTIGSCCGHGASSLSIWFKVSSDVGLFFLSRCCDKRYWKYGYLWNIEVLVGDRFINSVLPITYHLHSGTIIGDDAYEQAKDLVRNMEVHLNISAFIEGYGINLDSFEGVKENMDAIELVKYVPVAQIG